MEQQTDKQLIVVVGPTAVGKTALAIALAQHFNTEVISADSRQFYKEMTIGTAKPTPEELAQAPHHFINNLSVQDAYDAAQFAREAEICLADLFTRHDKAVVVGGSGMYIKALCEGLDEMPDVSEDLRASLNQEWVKGNKQQLLDELEAADPDYYHTADLNNKQRVTRALEIIRTTGKPYSSFRKGNKKNVNKGYSVVKIGLERERSALYHCIDARMDQMIAQGLEKEARQLYPLRELNALQTVGYREWFGYFDGEYDRQEAIRLLKRNSRRYAKRQMTWFKRDAEVAWFFPDQWDKIVAHVMT